MILFQEGVQLPDELVGISLSLLYFFIQPSDFLVEKFRHLVHIDEETVFIFSKVDFEEALIGLWTVLVRLDCLEDLHNFIVRFVCRLKQLLT